MFFVHLSRLTALTGSAELSVPLFGSIGTSDSGSSTVEPGTLVLLDVVVDVNAELTALLLLLLLLRVLEGDALEVPAELEAWSL